jgi:hypothetical protein
MTIFRGNEVIPCPEGVFAVDNLQNVLSLFMLPAVYIFGRHIGYKVRHAAFAALFAAYGILGVHFSAHSLLHKKQIFVFVKILNKLTDDLIFVIYC